MIFSRAVEETTTVAASIFHTHPVGPVCLMTCLKPAAYLVDGGYTKCRP